jgi:iron(III) transport system substrate-binding protein
VRRVRMAVVGVVLALGAPGCGDDGDETGQRGDAAGPLTVYSGREQELVEPLLEQFEKRTGIDLRVRYGESAELAATIGEEGSNTPADVFFAQDAGTLGAVAQDGRLADLPAALLERVDERFRDPEGRWVGTSGRARVIAYNTKALAEEEVPDSVFDLTERRWKGKIGLPPTNASFQAFVTAMRLTSGEERARKWLEDVKANDPRFYEKNSAVVEAVASGEIEVGLVNHYYLYLLKEEEPDAPVANHFLPGEDPGALVNAAGVGIVEGTDQPQAARRFVSFLLSAEGQRFYTTRAEEAEYPLVAGIPARAGLPPLQRIQGPDIRLDDLGPELEETLELLNELGYTS